VNVRLVCATNKDLEQEVQNKNFRADLFYRLSTFIIHVPPLRERKEDIPLLVNYFLHKICRGREPVNITPEAIKLLMDYPWPGNVRELFNILARACILSGGDLEIKANTLPLDITKGRLLMTDRTDRKGTHATRLEDAQKDHIRKILAATDGNKSRAARILGISRSRLYHRIAEK
jgi:transcriptional regulator with PAS, ATPase and Fis domain